MPTSLTSFLVLEAYRTALIGFFEAEPNQDADFRAGIATFDGAEPESQKEFTRWRILRALRVAYDVASNEGLDEVVGDIGAAFPDLDEEQLGRVLDVLTPSDDLTQKLDFGRQRDGFLPILRSTKFALDLRVAESGTAASLLPLVTARLGFDEPVGNNEALVFQVPTSSLEEIASELLALAERVRELPATLERASIPEWTADEADASSGSDRIGGADGAA